MKTDREKQNAIIQGAILEAKYQVNKFICIHSQPFQTFEIKTNDTKLQSKTKSCKFSIRVA